MSDLESELSYIKHFVDSRRIISSKHSHECIEEKDGGQETSSIAMFNESKTAEDQS